MKRRDWQNETHFLLLVPLKILLGSLARWTHWETYLDSPNSLIKSPSWVHIPFNTHCKMLHVGIFSNKLLPATWSGCLYLAILFAIYLLSNLLAFRLHVDSSNQHLLSKKICYKNDSYRYWKNLSALPLC